MLGLDGVSPYQRLPRPLAFAVKRTPKVGRDSVEPRSNLKPCPPPNANLRGADCSLGMRSTQRHVGARRSLALPMIAPTVGVRREAIPPKVGRDSVEPRSNLTPCPPPNANLRGADCF